MSSFSSVCRDVGMYNWPITILTGTAFSLPIIILSRSYHTSSTLLATFSSKINVTSFSFFAPHVCWSLFHLFFDVLKLPSSRHCSYISCSYSGVFYFECVLFFTWFVARVSLDDDLPAGSSVRHDTSLSWIEALSLLDRQLLQYPQHFYTACLCCYRLSKDSSLGLKLVLKVVAPTSTRSTAAGGSKRS